MSQVSESERNRQTRVFPQHRLTAEEKAKRQEEIKQFDADCQAIFEKVKPALIKDYYNWFMVIEPKSGDYFIDADEIEAEKKAQAKHPDSPCLLLCINETGVCGRV
ncbi:MAG: hypothetical protein ACRC8Y_02285 [Chroococcales cyanobacterium]